MPSIADLFISVSSDVSGAISGLTSVDEKVNGTTTAMQSATPAALALGAAAGAVGAGFLSSITVAQDFEHQMNGIKSVMSPDDVNTYGAAVEDLALKLGKDTTFSASQAADAIQEMIKAGVPLPAILGGAAQSALDLASATGVNVTDAADLASKAMNTFHESADELPHTMDTIANVSNATATGVSELKFALEAVGPVANAIGLNFDDTATAIGIFANNGLVGSDAGTSLKTMLLNLQPSTAKQSEEFNKLGLTTYDAQKAMDFLRSSGIDPTGLSLADLGDTVMKTIIGTDDLSTATKAQMTAYDKTAQSLGIVSSAFFDANGSAKSMRDIFQVLQDATAGLTDAQKIQALQTLFGTDAVRAATIAANEGAEGWDKVAAAMEAQGGTAVAAATRNAGLTGAMNQLSGTIETIQITIGNLFLPVLTQMVTGLTNVLNTFLTLDPTVQMVLAGIVALGAVIAGAAAAWVLLGPVIASIGAAFEIIGPILLGVSAPILAIVAAAALLYAAWQDDFGGIREVTAQVWDAIQPGLQNIMNLVNTIKDALAPAFQGVTDSSGPLIEQLSQALAPILAQLPGLIKDAGDQFNRIGDAMHNVGDVVSFLVSGNFSALFDLMHNGVPPEFLSALISIHDAFDAIGPVVRTITDVIHALITGDFNEMVALMANGLPQGFVAGLQFVHDVLATLIQVQLTVLGGLKDFIGYLASGDVTGAFNSLADTFGKVKDLIVPLWNEFLLVMGNLLQALPGFVGDRVGDLWNALVSSVADIGPKIGPAFSNLLAYIGLQLDQLKHVVDWGALWQAFIDSVWNIGTLIGPAFANFMTFIGLEFDQLKHIVDWGALWQAFIDSVWNIGTSIGPAFANFMTFIGLQFDLITHIVDWGALWKNFTDSAWNIGTEIGNAFGNFMTFIGLQFDLIKNIVDWSALWKNFTDSAWNIGTEIGNAFGNFMTFIGLQFDQITHIVDWGVLWKNFTDSAWNIGTEIGNAFGNFMTFIGLQFDLITHIVDWDTLWKNFTDSAWNIGTSIGDAFGNFMGFIGTELGKIPDLIAGLANGDIFGEIITQALALPDRIAAAIEPIKKILSDTFGSFWQFLTGSTLLSGSGGDGTGGTGGTGGTTGTGGGPIVSVGTLIIANEKEATDFLNLVAQAVLASSRRVSVPTTGGNPVLG